MKTQIGFLSGAALAAAMLCAPLAPAELARHLRMAEALERHPSG